MPSRYHPAPTMTLDDLIEWVDERMERLPRDREARDRVKHVRRLYRMLDPNGYDWSLRNEWHALAVKVAALVKEPTPKKPRVESSQRRKRERERWREIGRASCRERV